LLDKASNRVKTFNSVIAKCTGGKRINFGLRGSYETRCNAAAVAFNTGEPINRLSYTLGMKSRKVAVKLENEKKMQKSHTVQRKNQ
jgi:hypothetical protein